MSPTVAHSIGSPGPLDPADAAPARDWRASSRLDLRSLWIRPPRDPDYQARPLFSHPILNRAVIVKFNMAPQDARRDLPRRLGATKLMLPLQTSRGRVMAKCLIIAPHDLDIALQAELDYRAYDLERDMALLRRLDWLPSLDPYILGEMARHFRLGFGECYLQAPRGERQAIAARVLAEIAPQLQWQLGLAASPKALPLRAAVQLLAQGGGPAATDAAAAQLGLKREGLSLALLSWKGLVYYRRRFAGMDREVRRVADEIAGATPQRSAPPDALAMIDLARGRVLRALTLARREAIALTDAMDETLAALDAQRHPRRFADFLQFAPVGMAALGERVRRLDEVCGGWRSSAADGTVRMDAGDLAAVLAALEQQLATDLTLKPARVVRPGLRG